MTTLSDAELELNESTLLSSLPFSLDDPKFPDYEASKSADRIGL